MNLDQSKLFKKLVIGVPVLVCLSCLVIPLLSLTTFASVALFSEPPWLKSAALIALGFSLVWYAYPAIMRQVGNRNLVVETCNCGTSCDISTTVNKGEANVQNGISKCSQQRKSASASKTLKALITNDLIRYDKEDHGFLLKLKHRSKARAEEVVEDEKQCCGHLNFELTNKPDYLQLRISTANDADLDSLEKALRHPTHAG